MRQLSIKTVVTLFSNCVVGGNIQYQYFETTMFWGLKQKGNNYEIS